MFTNKDIEYKSVFVINCIKDRDLRVSSGEMLLEDTSKQKTLTKLPFQKILALFIIGHIRITTPLIEKCKKYNVALVVMKPSLRPVFFWAGSAEANYLVRQRQFLLDKENISLAKIIVKNKIDNSITLLRNTRRKDNLTLSAIQNLLCLSDNIYDVAAYDHLMGFEGTAAKCFFTAYYHDLDWKGRRPRMRTDWLNVVLDIGYMYLFNFIEMFVRMFGFDVYVGFYHRLWFKRKSLVCDFVEPFRCIIDKTVRVAVNRKQFQKSDFSLIKGEYRLCLENNGKYSQVFFDALIGYKMEIFSYVRSFYRCFMRGSEMSKYPNFVLK